MSMYSVPIAMLCLKNSKVDQRGNALCSDEVFSEAEKTDIGKLLQI